MHHILSSTLLALQAGSMEWWSDGEREMFSLRFMYSSNLSARGTAGGGEQGEELVAPLRSVQPRPGMTHRDFPFPITWHPSWGDRIQLSPNSCVCRHGYASNEAGKCWRNVYLVCLPWLAASVFSERNCIREKVVFCLQAVRIWSYRPCRVIWSQVDKLCSHLALTRVSTCITSWPLAIRSHFHRLHANTHIQGCNVFPHREI